MAEIITLTTPVMYPSNTTVRIDKIHVDFETQTIHVQWLGSNNEFGSAVYPTPAVLNPLGITQPTGLALLHIINTTNFTVTSLAKRILLQLQTDGYLAAGSISGVAI